jgi:hypothetical protein
LSISPMLNNRAVIKQRYMEQGEMYSERIRWVFNFFNSFYFHTFILKKNLWNPQIRWENIDTQCTFCAVYQPTNQSQIFAIGKQLSFGKFFFSSFSFKL